MATTWRDLSGWSKGPVTLFNALGIKGAKYPQLQAQFPQQIGNSTGTPNASGGTGTSTSTSGAGGTPASHSDAANQALGQHLAAAYGWGSGAQWAALNSLVMSESHWDNTIWNGQGSGAYGIAQSLPASKYPLAGRPPSEGGTSDPTAQINWMLNYIKTNGNFHDPISAWAFHQVHNWY
jgi:hypothetical protein